MERCREEQPELKELLPGRQADITLLKIESGAFELVDSLGEVRHARERLVPVQVFKCGELYECKAV